ncbi:hypothetical protein ACQW02_10810 [Humitalea sp. 24SJ18S-53]|uniref:hypothetical protein n=1 Tax=Humitalea sp. 24SJ18S-53 TaxID=3422307 RepID=UPI003D6780CA
MSPEDYLRQFHPLKVFDAKLGISASIDVKNYISGMPDSGQTEYNKISGLIAGRYFGSKHWSVSDLIKQTQPFCIKGAEGIDPTEQWTIGSIRRAFGGRASPEEMMDGLRLAVLTGRCKASEVATYGAKHMGLDCNAFVGNWLGVSPSTSIAAYAHGYGKKTPKGATADVLVTKDIIHLPPVTDPAKIQQGTVLATFSKLGGTGSSNYRHIALVQSCVPVAGGKYKAELCEWGGAGGFEAHKATATFALTTAKKLDGIPETMIPGKDTLAYQTKWGGHNAFRVFLDSTSLDYLASRGWEVGGLYGT